METPAFVDPQPTDAGNHLPPQGQPGDRAERNRRNGRQSHGPVTPAGKDRSRCNAVTHGLFARVVPLGQLPVFADRREYLPLVDRMQAEFGVRTSMGMALVESLSLDLLRLRQIRAMEIAIFDPGVGMDRDLEQAIQTRERANHRRTDEDNEALHQAYAVAAAQVRAGEKISIPPELVPTVTGELWQAMTSARQYLARNQEELRDLDEQIAAAEPSERAALQETRAVVVESIAADEIDMKATDKETFLIDKMSDLDRFIAGRAKVPPAMRDRWIELLERRKRVLENDMGEVRNADVGINLFRRRHMLAAVNRLDDLNRLGEYEDRIRRSISKTVALIKEVEAGAVIDVPTA